MKKYLQLLDTFLYSALEDCVSFRNKMVIFMGFCFLYALVKIRDAAIVATMGSLWTIILCYYFHQRQVTALYNAEHKQNGTGVIISSPDSETI